MDGPRIVVGGVPTCPDCKSTRVTQLDQAQDHPDFQTVVTSYRCACGMGFTQMTWKDVTPMHYRRAA